MVGPLSESERFGANRRSDGWWHAPVPAIVDLVTEGAARAA
jgi:hypothetical protein